MTTSEFAKFVGWLGSIPGFLAVYFTSWAIMAISFAAMIVNSYLTGNDDATEVTRWGKDGTYWDQWDRVTPHPAIWDWGFIAVGGYICAVGFAIVAVNYLVLSSRTGVRAVALKRSRDPRAILRQIEAASDEIERELDDDDK